MTWEPHGDVWLGRADTYTVGDVCGVKARVIDRRADGARGLATCGSRSSNQITIAAGVAAAHDIPARVFVPDGPDTPEIAWAESRGATVVRVPNGRMSVLTRRMFDDVQPRGYTAIPWALVGMDIRRDVVDAIGRPPDHVQRIVIPIGSGYTAAMVAWEMTLSGDPRPIVGVTAGASPVRRLDRWGPPRWRDRITLVPSGRKHGDRTVGDIDGVVLDPVYGTPVLPILRPADGVVVAGRRPGATDHIVRVSLTWLGHRHDCTVAGIAARCGGRCCWNTDKASVAGAMGAGVGQPCPALDLRTGCTLADDVRPVSCHLYPLRITGDRVGRHFRAGTMTGPCKGNAERGPLLVDAIAGGLRAVFGDAGFDRMARAVYAGRTGVMEIGVPADTWARHGREVAAVVAGVPPVPNVTPANDGPVARDHAAILAAVR